MPLFDSAGKEAGLKAAETLGPTLREAELSFFSGMHSLLTRINIKCDFHFSIDPPVARYANPPPEQDKVY